MPTNERAKAFTGLVLLLIGLAMMYFALGFWSGIAALIVIALGVSVLP